MTIKLFALAALMVFATVLFLAIVILEDPPAFFGYFLSTTTGASRATFFLLWNRQACDSDKKISPNGQTNSSGAHCSTNGSNFK